MYPKNVSQCITMFLGIILEVKRTITESKPNKIFISGTLVNTV